MPDSYESLKHGRTMRCAICDGKFGLVRYYSWRTPLCSKRCVDRFAARRQSNCNWVGWLHFAENRISGNRARAA